MGYIIAIDGPAGAGKSTIARGIAERLGFTYIDTGAMYRTVALRALQEGVALDDAAHLEQLALTAGENPGDAIRTPEVSAAASKVAAVGVVRAAMVTRQRALAKTTNVVMEGRDIGTVVFPDAQVKIFLDADPAERVRRRGEPVAERDERDRTRAESPLVKAPDAIYLDSTGLSELEVQDAILKIVRANLLVMKFGGTSVGSAARIKAACALITAEGSKRPVIAVVSAMSKITDLLLDTTRHAEAGDRAGVEANLGKLEARHKEAAAELGLAIDPQIDELVAEFRRIVDGIQMLGHRPPRTVDEAVAIGERLSVLLVSSFLGVPGINSAELIVTDAVFNSASPLMAATEAKAKPRLSLLQIAIVTGFNGATADGRPTTLGRGGSDFSASILAAAMNASELWIWSDVDGILTADPRLVPDAKILSEVTYSEAAELAYAGAKVLHPRTLAPLIEQAIPVICKNSFAPEKPGTKIVPKLAAGNPGARAVTSMANVALVSIEPAKGVRVMARVLDALDQANIEVLALSSSSYRQSFCFLVRIEDLDAVTQAVEASLALELAHGYVRPIEVDRSVGLLAVVGEGMRGFSGMAGRIFTAISRESVNIIAIAQGSSELTISIVVRRDGLEKAVRAVHAECHL